MKNLTIKEYNEAPSIIQYIWAMSISNIPIGGSMYNNALKEHPEYFPDEVEHRRKYALIPEEIHKLYREASMKLWDEMSETLPSKGIVYWCNNPIEYEKWHKENKKLAPMRKKKYDALHQKYYGKYLD